MSSLRDVRVCVFGDSLVAGVGDPKVLGWVGRVAARTPPSTGLRLTVYALGVRGQSTEEIVVRIPLESSSRFARGAEHGVVLAVGVADAIAAVAPAQSAAALEFGLQSTSAHRLVVGPPPLGPPGVRAHIGQLDEVFADLCTRLGVRYVSTYRTLADRRRWNEQEFAEDIHPGQAGYGMLASAVLRGGWYDWLRAAAPPAPVKLRSGVRA